MADIIEIEGIGDVYAEKLRRAGLATVEALLASGSSPEGRKAIAEETGISPKRILRWVNIADLFRLKGAAEEYTELLEAAGVDTVVELARRNPDHLFRALSETNQERRLVRALPSKDRVAEWVSQAKILPRAVTY